MATRSAMNNTPMRTAGSLAGLLLLTAGLTAMTGWVNWAAVGRALQPYAFGIGLIAVGGVVVAAGWLHRPPAKRIPMPALTWWAVLLAVIVVVVVTYAATVWLLHEAANATDPGAARVNAVKTGLGIAAGTGGVFALILALRRQWHQELTAIDTTTDATERRITELYTKASEQLGSDKAPVRLAGLYALERLAQNNETQRQTIVNLICAYLRMPYTPPPRTTTPRTSGIHRPLRRITTTPKPTPAETKLDARQEREVRLTAQRILTHHLNPANPDTYWPDIDLDLTNATLIDFSLAQCHLNHAAFAHTTFHDTANFHQATFTGTAWFRRASFSGTVLFGGTSFGGDAWFEEASFSGLAGFDEASFSGPVRFGGASFSGPVRFGGARFGRDAWFDEASFDDRAWFGGASFGGDAWFEEASFGGPVRFDKANFCRNAGFDEASFGRNVRFDGVSFGGDAGFDEASFGRNAGFDGVSFGGDAAFGGANFGRDVRFHQASFSGRAGFEHASFSGHLHLDRSQVLGRVSFVGARFELEPPEWVGEMGDGSGLHHVGDVP
ncbi:pentapeptide repeat-containing protein [Actinokineospora inagensis]|uniref:pentapeptide repeat-containing protein n=1 Tax=Actinokineospora inagensis TaxID=103730 RepID=UPI00146FA804|nr:pentapeptide repeat-containing protein [Actinokineospora inagensis]